MRKSEVNAELGKKIFNARKALGYSRVSLGELIGLHETTIKKYEDGNIKNVDIERVKDFAKALSVSAEFLLGWDSPKKDSSFSHPDILPIRTKKIPLIGEIACGKPIVANREYSLYEVDEHIHADFCIKARGDSMIGARINDGDIVFIKECPEVNNGEIAAIIIDDSVTLKRVYLNKEKGQLILNAENIAYSPMIYTNEELKKIRILGRAIGFQSVLK